MAKKTGYVKVHEAQLTQLRDALAAAGRLRRVLY